MVTLSNFGNTLGILQSFDAPGKGELYLAFEAMFDAFVDRLTPEKRDAIVDLLRNGNGLSREDLDTRLREIDADAASRARRMGADDLAAWGLNAALRQKIPDALK